MSSNKTRGSIRMNSCFFKYRKLINYAEKCVTCQTRRVRNQLDLWRKQTYHHTHLIRYVLIFWDIHLVKTYSFCRLNNGKVERLKRELHDVMAKTITRNLATFSLNTSCLHVNESSKFAPSFLIHSHNVNFPLDNLMKKCMRYSGEEQYEVD